LENKFTSNILKTLARTLRENNKIMAPGARYPNST
jgi:hypothetical protein